MLPAGERVPAYGQGTWYMGEDAARAGEEIAALQLGLDLGARLIDTAEMYADGGAERVVGRAIAGRREDAFVVSKVYPHNATRRGAIAACERSLKRLATDCIDLYLLHWRGSVPLAETMEAFATLQRDGKIRHYGVSNLDVKDMAELVPAPGGDAVQVDQVLYNLMRRGIEWDLLPALRARRIPVMAYSPLEQARLLRHAGLVALAGRLGMTAAQVALAWLARHDDVIVIPKTSSPARLRQNIAALKSPLPADALAELDRLFPPPQGAQALEML
jgi:diketogulonate reductase-like aldo/keto reductase